MRYCKLTPCTVNEKECDAKEDKISPGCMHCMYCVIPKGTSRAEMMFISEKSGP